MNALRNALPGTACSFVLAVALATSIAGVVAPRPPAGVPTGGQNLKRCLQGIQIWSLGHDTGNDLLEVAGGLLAYFNCR